jgi:hypothetical protein
MFVIINFIVIYSSYKNLFNFLGKSENKIGLPPRNRNENIHNTTNNSNLINKSSITYRNRDVIANCLGIESSRVIRRNKKNKSNSIPGKEFDRENNKTTNRIIVKNKIIEGNNNLKDKNNSMKKFEEIEAEKSTGNNSKKPEIKNNCFVIFNKSNINNLKKEIQRYDSKNVTIETESLNASNIDETKKSLLKPNSTIKETQTNNIKFYRKMDFNYYSNEDFNSNPSKKENKNDFSHEEKSSRNRFLLFSPERNEIIDELEEIDSNNRNLPKYIINLAESKTNLEKSIKKYDIYLIFR